MKHRRKRGLARPVLAVFAMYIVGLGILTVNANGTIGSIAATSVPVNPTATVAPNVAAPGESVVVRGAGWTPGTLLAVELCGNAAIDATADCEVQSSQSIGVRSTGEFSTTIIAKIPKEACPCMVRVTSDNSTEVLTSLIIAGAPTGRPVSKVPDLSVTPQLDVTSVSVSGSGPWTSWFGGPARRNVTVVVKNVGTVNIPNPALLVTVGKQADPSGFVNSPDIGPLAPGASRTLTMRLSLQWFAFGSYTVKASVSAVGQTFAGRAQTSTYPWGLLAVPLLLLQFGLLALRNRARRLAGDDEEAAAAPVAPPVPVPVLAPVPVPVAASAEVDVAPEKRWWRGFGIGFGSAAVLAVIAIVAIQIASAGSGSNGSASGVEIPAVRPTVAPPTATSSPNAQPTGSFPVIPSSVPIGSTTTTTTTDMTTTTTTTTPPSTTTTTTPPPVLQIDTALLVASLNDAMKQILHMGSTGQPVRWLKFFLERAGYPSDDPDLIFGPSMDTALRAFQKKMGYNYGLGQCGPNNWAALIAH